MKTRILKCQSIQIPFKAKFAHNSAIREETEGIVVSITNDKNETGFGESCPRSYVTGESIQSAKAFINQIEKSLGAIASLADLIDLKKTLQESIDKNPSAWCAVELAMLDLLGKELNLSVEELLGLKPSAKRSSPYTAVLGIDRRGKFLIKLGVYKILGLHDFKIKLSGNHAQDLKRVKLIAKLASKIRVDANNLFHSPKEALSYLENFRSFIWAVEEPLVKHDFMQMKDIAEKLQIKIILDESFLNETSLESIKGMSDFFIPNLRLSKLGGVLRTLDLAKKLEASGFNWILGSHVGEMSLLTRASLLLSSMDSKKMMATEGGFSTHLLKDDPFYPNLKIGLGGILKNQEAIKPIGWGMTFRPRKEEEK